MLGVGRAPSNQLHDANQVEQSYQDPELPEAYNAPAILDSVLCFLCSIPCPLAECHIAGQVEQVVPMAVLPSPQVDMFFSRSWAARQELTLCLPSC